MPLALRSSLKTLVFLFTALLVHPAAQAEGSKEANVNGGPQIQLEIGRGPGGQNLGPFFGCDSTQRIYVTLENANEAIYFGFQEGGDNLWVRIMDSDGNKVWPAGTSWSIPSSGAGYISSQSRANAGPVYTAGGSGAPYYVTSSSGYTPQVFSPGAAGCNTPRNLDHLLS